MTPLAARTAGARLKRRILLFLAFAALALATRAVVLGAGIVDLDEAAYATIARGMLHGQALYAQVADHKPPLVFAWFALAQGMMLGPSMLSVRLLTYLLLPPLTALGMSAFFDHDRRGVIAGVTWLVYGAAFVGHDMLAVNCESLMMLPLVWSVVILRRPEDARRALRLLLAGALVGIATLFKYHAALWLPIGIVGAWGVSSSPPARVRGALRASLALGTGFARPLLSAYALFAVRGTDPDFIYWNLTHNFSYVAATVGLRTAMERAASSVLPFLLHCAFVDRSLAFAGRAAGFASPVAGPHGPGSGRPGGRPRRALLSSLSGPSLRAPGVGCRALAGRPPAAAPLLAGPPVRRMDRSSLGRLHDRHGSAAAPSRRLLGAPARVSRSRRRDPPARLPARRTDVRVGVCAAVLLRSRPATGLPLHLRGLDPGGARVRRAHRPARHPPGPLGLAHARPAPHATRLHRGRQRCRPQPLEHLGRRVPPLRKPAGPPLQTRGPSRRRHPVATQGVPVAGRWTCPPSIRRDEHVE